MWILTSLALLQSSPVPTLYLSREPLAIRSVSASSTTAGEVVELKVDATGTFDNPFDPADVALEAKVTTPKGDSYTLPGYFAAEHRREGDDVRPAGEKGWRVRFFAPAAGDYDVETTFRDRSGTTSLPSQKVTVEGSDRKKGMVRLSPRDRRYFETEDGKAFFPLGSNIGWGGEKALGDYAKWLPNYGRNGANWGRIWLSPAWTTHALEVVGKPEEGKGLGVFDQRNASRLDETMRMAAANGIYLQLCIDSYNVLRDRDGHPYWDQSPHNREHGGPLRLWSEFWTNPIMDRLYRAKLRYLVARYSAYPNMFAWEFWNEVDLTRDFEVEVVRAWHERMGRALKEIDPYRHLVSTSFAGSNGFREIDLMPEMDFVQTHYYGQDPGGHSAWQQTRKGSWGKAHFVAEVGADAGGARGGEDKRGYQIHDPQWASIATGAAGGAMPWWWDSYIEPLNLYPIFGAARRFVDGIDWPGEGFRQARPTLSYAVPPKSLRMKDAILAGGAVTWERSDVNRPTIVRYANGAFRGKAAGIQHGLVNHGSLHNPIQFLISVGRPTKFAVEVGNVSGHGGAKMVIGLNGKTVMTRDFADADGTAKTDDLTRYAGTYEIPIPAGNHSVTVENTGTDWFMVSSYRLRGMVAQKTPPAVTHAITGEHTALVWLRSEEATWRSEIVGKKTPAPIPGSVLRLPGLSSGRWDVEHWNTWAGTKARTQTVTVDHSGVLRVQLPPIPRDLALKIRKR